MSSINFAAKEISVKIVYYGPGLCGKTTTLHHIYTTISPEHRPKLVSLATDVDRTIFFDFLPVAAYRVRDFLIRLQLYTVPGQVFYNSTRKLVLSGADGVVFVADSQRLAIDSNLESYRNLEENLREQGVELAGLPHVLQLNKRDLPEIMSAEELGAALNRYGAPSFPSIATTGQGVLEALKEISKLVINDLNRKGLGRKLNAEPSAPLAAEPAAPAGSALADALQGSLAVSAPPQTAAVARVIAATLQPPPGAAPTPASAVPSAHTPPGAAPSSAVAAQRPPAIAPARAPLAPLAASGALAAGAPAALAALWRTPRQRELAERFAAQLAQGERAAAIALAELLEEAVRCNVPPAGQGWDSTQCALYKGLPGPLWTAMQQLLEGQQALDGRVLALMFVYAAVAVDGWGTLAGT